jgi:hypothetical protein
MNRKVGTVEKVMDIEIRSLDQQFPQQGERPPRGVICEEIIRSCAERYAKELRAVVLTGSMARDEGTFVTEGKHWRVLGDAEALLVFRSDATLPSALEIGSLQRSIQKTLLARGVSCQISLSAVHPKYLRSLRPHIFAYELKACGQVIWGDSAVLSLIPPFSEADIPLEDAWRLLGNRMIEQLEVAEELANRHQALSADAYYRTVKLFLDVATSYLLFQRAYAPSYRKREENLSRLVGDVSAESCSPFSQLGRFSEHITACTEFKLGECGRSGNASEPCENLGSKIAFWKEGVTHARELWRWELARLTEIHTSIPESELLTVWMRRQPLREKLRGWAYVVRSCGWLRAWRQWPRWVSRLWAASPRYWLYAAASSLLFRLPELAEGDGELPGEDVDWRQIRCSLPVVREATGQVQLPGWQQAALDIVWNYHRFLEGTRA